MINYLTAEFNKLLHRKNFYLGLSFVILASLINIIILPLTNPHYTSITYTELQQLLLHFVGNKFIAVITVFVITVSISGANGSNVKNAITMGYSRLQIYFSKIIIGASIITFLLFAAIIATFIFTGIWFYHLFTIRAVWEALIRFSLVYLVYIALFAISLTLCYVINYNMLFAIVYFVLFRVLAEIFSTTSNSQVIQIIANYTLTNQLEGIILGDHKMYLWPYVLGTSVGYTAFTLILGAIIINRKDIK